MTDPILPPLGSYPMPVIEAVSRLMRLADAYAYDSKGVNKVVASRFVLDRGIAAEITAAVMAEREANAKIAEALANLLEWAEWAEVKIEGEWGAGRSLEQMERDGSLSEEIVKARAAIREGVK